MQPQKCNLIRKKTYDDCEWQDQDGHYLRRVVVAQAHGRLVATGDKGGKSREVCVENGRYHHVQAPRERSGETVVTEGLQAKQAAEDQLVQVGQDISRYGYAAHSQ